MDETFFKKIAQAHIPWMIHFTPIGVLMIVILFPNVTYRWKMMGELIIVLYAYILSFVELTHTSRRPTHSGMLHKRIKLDLALLIQIVATIGIWNLDASNHYLFWVCIVMVLIAGATIFLEWLIHWP